MYLINEIYTEGYGEIIYWKGLGKLKKTENPIVNDIELFDNNHVNDYNVKRITIFFRYDKILMVKKTNNQRDKMAITRTGHVKSTDTIRLACYHVVFVKVNQEIGRASCRERV